jgi:Sporulation initiation factor Spo0A C terminal.
MEKVLDEILLILKDERDGAINVKVISDKSLDERLANIFISSGIPPHIKGYQFLREAVKQSVKSPAMINNITKQLYPAVAEKFNTSPSKVERAIRHAIEVAWSRGKIDNINTIYGIKVFGKGDKPTNGELIALVSDKMIIECS